MRWLYCLFLLLLLLLFLQVAISISTLSVSARMDWWLATLSHILGRIFGLPGHKILHPSLTSLNTQTKLLQQTRFFCKKKLKPQVCVNNAHYKIARLFFFMTAVRERERENLRENQLFLLPSSHECEKNPYIGFEDKKRFFYILLC